MSHPPALARLIFRLLPLGVRRAEIERDLSQVLAKHQARGGRRAARRRYWKEIRSLTAWSIRHVFISRHAPINRHASIARQATFPGGTAVNELFRDIRYGLRGLRRQPAYTVLAVVTLALGVGATTVMFTMVEGVLLRPLPVDQPERLMMVWETTPRTPQNVAI